MRATAEFLVEPFEEGSIGPHVRAAIHAFEKAGLEVDVGPFGNTVTGDHLTLVTAMSEAMAGALDSGASRLNINVWVDR